MYTLYLYVAVAPYMGAWVEISVMKSLSMITGVAPYMGAWVEISTGQV